MDAKSYLSYGARLERAAHAMREVLPFRASVRTFVRQAGLTASAAFWLSQRC